MNKLLYILLFLLVSLSASAQTFTLKGTVKETNGTPLLGGDDEAGEDHVDAGRHAGAVDLDAREHDTDGDEGFLKAHTSP